MVGVFVVKIKGWICYFIFKNSEGYWSLLHCNMVSRIFSKTALQPLLSEWWSSL